MPVKEFTDQLGRKVSVAFPPGRIVSVVPSQTELLAWLGLQDEVVGITRFCVHPESWHLTKTRVGGTKKLKTDVIRQLQPDLIIANKEENDRQQIMELAGSSPVWISDVKNLDEAFAMITQVGELTNRVEAATELVRLIKDKFAQLSPAARPLRACYFIWQRPYMVAGSGTFIDGMMQRCGLINVFAGRQQRYPEVTAEDIAAAKPDVMLLSSEPFPFRQKHIPAFHQLYPSAQVMLVDGEMFSWYGSRLVLAADYFNRLAHQLNILRV